jgi:hypothetical protein
MTQNTIVALQIIFRNGVPLPIAMREADARAFVVAHREKRLPERIGGRALDNGIEWSVVSADIAGMAMGMIGPPQVPRHGPGGALPPGTSGAN